MTAFDHAKDRLRLAKEVSLIGYIKEQGGKLSDNGSYYSMYSPFHAEQVASFKIDKRNPTKWKDFSNGKRGDIIDYVQEIQGITKKNAIDLLLKKSTIQLPEYEPIKRERKSIEIISISDTFTPELRRYLIHREISIEVAQKWLKCAVIRFPYSTINPEKEHTVLAWRNDSGGYEFRGGRIKLSNAPKNVTTIKGNPEVVSVYEGWPDYLTHLTMHKISQFQDMVIVLNSISFLGSILPMIKDKAIAYYGQNDKAGDNALTVLNNECTKAVWDMRKTYRDYKDLNDKACNKPIPKKMKSIKEILA